jgi:hypothetical protein
MDHAVALMRKHSQDVDAALAKLSEDEILVPQELKKLLEASNSKDYPQLLRNQVVLLYGVQLRLQAHLDDLFETGEIVNLRNQQLLRNLVTCICALDMQVEEKTMKLLRVSNV